MANKKNIHRRIVNQIQKLMKNYETLPPDLKKEVLRFLSTAEMVTEIKLTSKNKNFYEKARNSFNVSESSKHYLII
jgi:hypothetical protein